MYLCKSTVCTYVSTCVYIWTDTELPIPKPVLRLQKRIESVKELNKFIFNLEWCSVVASSSVQLSNLSVIFYLFLCNMYISVYLTCTGSQVSLEKEVSAKTWLNWGLNYKNSLYCIGSCINASSGSIIKKYNQIKTLTSFRMWKVPDPEGCDTTQWATAGWQHGRRTSLLEDRGLLPLGLWGTTIRADSELKITVTWYTENRNHRDTFKVKQNSK